MSNENFRKLKYNIYADDWRNYGMRSSLFFKLRSDRSWLLVLIRVCQFFSAESVANPQSYFNKLLKRIFFLLLMRCERKLGVEINPLMIIGEGLCLPHPNGIILHGGAIIGKNCTILQQVTIGNNIAKGKDNLAVIGDNVTISAGAKIIGPCVIGNNVIIGANAVVVKDIPDNCVVGGVPAKIISRNVPPSSNSDFDATKY